MGAPSAPNATVAVSARSDMPAAASGEKPSPISIAALTATGVPKPAAPSKKAPKQKAMSRSCMPPVGGDRAHGMLEDGEMAFVHREAVEEDHIDDDPADREEAADKAQHSGLGSHAAGMWKAKMATSKVAATAIKAAQ